MVNDVRNNQLTQIAKILGRQEDGDPEDVLKKMAIKAAKAASVATCQNFLFDDDDGEGIRNEITYLGFVFGVEGVYKDFAAFMKSEDDTLVFWTSYKNFDAEYEFIAALMGIFQYSGRKMVCKSRHDYMPLCGCANCSQAE